MTIAFHLYAEVSENVLLLQDARFFHLGTRLPSLCTYQYMQEGIFLHEVTSRSHSHLVSGKCKPLDR